MKRVCQPQPCKTARASRSCWRSLVFLLATSRFLTGGAFAAESRHSLADYLAKWQLTPSGWRDSFQPDGPPVSVALSPAAGRLVVRLLDRLDAAPPEWQQAWAVEALPLTHETASDSLGACRPVRLEGTITEAVHVNLSEELALVAGRRTLGQVTLTQPGGLKCRLLVPELPIGLFGDAGIGQRGGAIAVLVAEESPQDSGPESFLAVSTRLSWWPETPLGHLGMDYGLFGSVRDGQPLVAEEAEAFYAALAACRNAPEPTVKLETGEGDLVPLLDPAANWFDHHRGEQVVVAGTARRIVRVPVPEPRWQMLLGRDHYWEVFVFIPTPLIEVAGHLQESFPVVCCCLELPAEIPRGARVNEPVSVTGFGFKRYRYETRRAATASSRGQPQEAPLLVSRSVQWLPTAAPIGLPLWGKWLPAMAAVVATVGLLWAFLRTGRRRTTAALPEQIEIPLVAGGAAPDEESATPPSRPGGDLFISPEPAPRGDSCSD